MFVRSILVVCVGNMCRSPIGQYLMAERFENVEVSSAGLMAREDKKACGTAIDVAARNALDIENHRTRKLTKQMVMENDLVLAMESWHIQEIQKLVPFVQGKVMLLGKWNNEIDIPDPYQRSIEIYETVFNQIKNNVQQWAEKLDR